MKSTERALLREILASVASHITPLAKSDMILLIEIARAAWDVLSKRGVICPFGVDGEQAGMRLCVPGKWREDERTYHESACGHCPLWQKYTAYQED